MPDLVIGMTIDELINALNVYKNHGGKVIRVRMINDSSVHLISSHQLKDDKVILCIDPNPIKE